MAFINGPNIVQDNLIVCWDPQNSQSKNTLNYKVYNTVSPQFEGTAYDSFIDPVPAQYPNYLVFDGINDTLSSGTNFPATTAFSLNFWVKHTGTQSGGFERIFGTSGNRWELAESNTGVLKIYEGAWQTSTVTLDDAGWVNLVVINTVDPEIKIYKNGVLEQTIVAGRSMTDVAWRLGGNSNTPPTECWQGNMGYFSAYTKELSNAEVIQNYNALKSRFA